MSRENLYKELIIYRRCLLEEISAIDVVVGGIEDELRRIRYNKMGEVCKARKELGMTQKEFGATIGVSQSTILKFEKGMGIRPQTRDKILETLKISKELN